MRLTREKIIQLSHQISAAIEGLDEVEIFEEINTVRQAVVKILTELMVEEEKIEEGVRQHIASQKRTIPEGSEEWDILFKKYYAEALRKLGITLAPPQRV